MSQLLTAVAVASALSAAVILAVTPERTGTAPAHPKSRSSTRGLQVLLRRRRGPDAAQLRLQSATLLRQLSALLQSGRSEAQAWADLHQHWTEADAEHPLARICAHAVTAERTGLGTAEGLRRAGNHLLAGPARRAGALNHRTGREVRSLLDRLRAAVALSEQTGAPMSQLLQQMAASADEADSLDAAVRTACAGPKVTQLILSLLPVGGIILGQLMGAAPVKALLEGGFGLLCLITGVLVLLLGRLWSRRMIQRVEASL
ncbi:type II secretion system F family protein [Nesterenkonia flava]|uniref:Type II secretion system protein GspF domain-containing protein n=1 Tax=Nesterenkonia flava TaxID=469799 RepID=A0ABU1FUH2_9MICC|nr:hypothetical protein [Nesterenkonia flava]MDR5712306.1 hypothetical protein [Nesterenkonia flava]